MREARYIFVTGGVVSSVGKGITVASIGQILKARGINVSILKLDPYINVDPGTMNPYQHGEASAAPSRSSRTSPTRSRSASSALAASAMPRW